MLIVGNMVSAVLCLGQYSSPSSGTLGHLLSVKEAVGWI